MSKDVEFTIEKLVKELGLRLMEHIEKAILDFQPDIGFSVNLGDNSSPISSPSRVALP